MPIPALIVSFVLPVFAAGPAQSIADLEREAGERYRRGSYQEAERLQEKVLQLYKDTAGTPPGDLENACYRLAGIYLAQGKLTLAERYAEAASSHQRRSASSADRARILNMFAQIRFQQRRYQEAAETQEKAVRLMEPDGPSTGLARMINDLAMIRAATGELRLARPLLERAVELHRQSAGQPDDGAGETLGNLALVCARQGDYREAEANYRQAVGLMERTRGPYHPHLGMLLSEYSAVLKKNGRKAEARAMDRRAKAILQSARLPAREVIDASALRQP